MSKNTFLSYFTSQSKRQKVEGEPDFSDVQPKDSVEIWENITSNSKDKALG